MSGNCATGMRVSAIAPAMVMTMAMTMARRGRVMKTPEIMARSSSAGARRRRGRAAGGRAWRAGCRRLDAGGAGRDRLSRAHALDALDDDALAFAEPAGHRRQRRRRLAELDAALLRLVVAVDDVDVVAHLVGEYRGARHRQRLE